MSSADQPTLPPVMISRSIGQTAGTSEKWRRSISSSAPTPTPTQTIRVVGLNLSQPKTSLVADTSSKWHRNFEFSNISYGLNEPLPRHDYSPILDRLSLFEHQTHSELRDLSSRVDTLTRALEAVIGLTQSHEPIPATEPPETSVDEDFLTEARKSGDLSTVFNQIADGEIDAPRTIAVELALASLKDDDPTIRAAAGRALSNLAPELALITLPSAIEDEGSRFVRSILVGALRAASA